MHWNVVLRELPVSGPLA